MKTALLFFVLSTTAAFAQPSTCGGLTSVRDDAKPVYPPIANAARVGGDVALLVSFKTTGEADEVKVVSGPLMLQQAAMDYVKTWRANKYGAPRSCEVTISYVAPPHPCKKSRGSVKRIDSRHVVIHGTGTVCTTNY
jgi:TonB family protein